MWRSYILFVVVWVTALCVDEIYALIKLNRPALLGPTAGLICLPPQGYWPKPGATCYITGWGSTDPKKANSRADTLQQTQTPIVDLTACKRNFWVTNTTQTTIARNKICSGDKNTGQHKACRTDSGDPVVCIDSSGQWVLQGVVNVGAGGCTPEQYDVNARVGYFANWIRTYTVGV